MMHWIVKLGNAHVIVLATNREGAKRSALLILGSDPDIYTVTPLTQPGDRLWIHLPVTT